MEQKGFCTQRLICHRVTYFSCAAVRAAFLPVYKSCPARMTDWMYSETSASQICSRAELHSKAVVVSSLLSPGLVDVTKVGCES